MLEMTPTGTRENGPYDMWDKCMKEVLQMEKQNVFKYEDGKILTPRGFTLNKETGERQTESSKLPEIYAKIVRTPSFLKWFGDWTNLDSVDVSEIRYIDTGEPQPYFHGTDINIPGQEGVKSFGGGIFFDRTLWTPTKYMGKEGSLFCVFLNVKKLRTVFDQKNIDGEMTHNYIRVFNTSQIMQVSSSTEEKFNPAIFRVKNAPNKNVNFDGIL
jgi:hypothetical protein